jgi:hypothetical protein
VGSNFEMGNFLDSGTWLGPNVVGARTTGNFGFNHGGISFGSQYGSNNTDLSYHLALYSNIWGIGITPNRMNVVMPAGGATQIFANSVMVGWTTSSGLTAGATLGANNGAALRAQNGSYYMAFIGQITASAFNVLCQANDAAIIYSATAMGTGALVIGAQASGAYGIRIDSAAGVSLNNNVTFSGAVASQLSSAAKGGTAYTVGANDSSFILNPSGPMTLTLPSASAQPGRELLMKLYSANAVSSASANVVPLNSATPGTAIMVGTAGKFCQLQSDGTNWQITMAN